MPGLSGLDQEDAVASQLAAQTPTMPAPITATRFASLAGIVRTPSCQERQNVNSGQAYRLHTTNSAAPM